MRRILSLLVVTSITVSLAVALAASAGAQTGDLAAMCQARLDANQVEGKKENLAVMDRAIAAAPADALPLITALRDGFAKKGEKFFNTPAGLQTLSAFDAYVYQNCPGTKVPVTAIDYEYDGVPASLPAGVAQFQMTNAAPKEDHMMAIFKLTPEGTTQDVTDILALPEKKQQQYIDPSSQSFLFAPAGQVSSAPIELQPGTYAYACFLPVGGKKGAPHFTEGMYGSFTVQ